MKIFVKAKPGSKKEKINKVDDVHFVVWVRERPEKGKANRAVARFLAYYFGVAPSRVKIISGHTSKNKVFEINQQNVG